jgi:hypothetical protein
MRNIYWIFLLLVLLFSKRHEGIAQVSQIFGVEVVPNTVEGSPIRSVVILLEKEGKQYLADSAELRALYDNFKLQPGGVFRQLTADLAISAFLRQPQIKSASYKVYTPEISGPVVLVISAAFLGPDETKAAFPTEKKPQFPVLSQTEKSKLTLILNGALGIYHDHNAFFSKGPEFTQGNPVADNAAVRGPRFWGETFLEPGIAGITQIGKTKIYPYAATSFLVSARNSSDIYSDGTALYGAVERLYAGVLFPQLGKSQQLSIDISAGRQFFQLNDGFLFSRYSGSANAGERGSVFLSSRTTYQMTALAKAHWKKFNFSGFFLEPQELFKDRQTNTRFLGGGLSYNDNKHLDLGLHHIAIPFSKASYTTPDGRIPLEGLQTLNPKIWINNIAGKGLFVKSELAYQWHNNADMVSNAWYLGGGLLKKAWKYSPSFYYRYAFMKGDDPNTARFERFDALLTGGLGNWIQGINFRKIIGDGNLITHRVEVKGYLAKNMDLSFDYFFLQADSYSNLGSLAPIANLTEKNYGHEFTTTYRYFLKGNFLFLSLFSWASPGPAIKSSFESEVYDWLSFQASFFMFY